MWSELNLQDMGSRVNQKLMNDIPIIYILNKLLNNCIIVHPRIFRQIEAIVLFVLDTVEIKTK